MPHLKTLPIGLFLAAQLCVVGSAMAHGDGALEPPHGETRAVLSAPALEPSEAWLEPAPPLPITLGEFRDQFIEIADINVDLAGPDTREAVLAARERVKNLSDEQLARLMNGGVSFDRLVNILRDLSTEVFAPTTQTKPQAPKATPKNESPDEEDAFHHHMTQYSKVCGTLNPDYDERADPDQLLRSKFLPVRTPSRTLFLTNDAVGAATVVWSNAARTCEFPDTWPPDTNDRDACIAADAVFYTLRTELNNGMFCLWDIMAKESEYGALNRWHLMRGLQDINSLLVDNDFVGTLDAITESLDELELEFDPSAPPGKGSIPELQSSADNIQSSANDIQSSANDIQGSISGPGGLVEISTGNAFKIARTELDIRGRRGVLELIRGTNLRPEGENIFDKLEALDTDVTVLIDQLIADLAAHDANIDADLLAHDLNIDADLVAHNANIVADLAGHDANLADHDAHINADLETHDVNITTLIGDLDTDVDDLRTELAAHDANIDADLAAHDANIDADLAAHDANIDADLAAHDANLAAHDVNLAAHDVNLAAHDANIDADLALHDLNLAAHDANIDGDIVVHHTEVTTQLDRIEALLGVNGRAVLEEMLAAGNCVPTIWLPAAQDGLLEDSVLHVRDLFNRVVLAGEPRVKLKTVETFLNKAERDISRERWVSACENLVKAMKGMTF